MEFIIIYLVSLLLIYFLFKKNVKYITKESNNEKNNVNNESNQITIIDENDLTYKTILFCYNFVKYAKTNNYTKKFDYDVWSLTTLMFQESGGLVLKKENYDIVGDDGNSIGYFQININGAYKDITKKYNLIYTPDDLKNKFINIYYASLYFYEAIKDYLWIEKDIYKVLWLGAKRYNGGLDETFNRKKNLKAVKYADKFIKNLDLVKSYIRGIEKE